jgi:glycerol-3-phosphate dehydrogenase
LLQHYGARLSALAALCRQQPDLAQPIHPDYPDVRAQISLAVREEFCRNLDDFLVRRTGLGFSPDQGQRAAEPAASLLAEQLGWDADERRRQWTRWEAYLARTAPAGVA